MKSEFALLNIVCCLFVSLPVSATDDPHAGTSSSAHCHDGYAGNHACSRIDLLSHVGISQLPAGSVSDIWGWVDPLDNREYAVLGHFNGTSFVDVTDPDLPVLKGYLPAHEDIASDPSSGVQKSCSSGFSAKSTDPATAHDDDEDDGCLHGEGSTWRDIKIFQNHAFVVSESLGHGMQVFDLTRLRTADNNSVFTEDAHHAELGSAHNIAINEDTARAYAVGSSLHAGGLYIFDISNPTMPLKIAGYANDGYTHDTQCVLYNGPDTRYSGRELCFSSNEDSVAITDVTNHLAISTIGVGTYNGASYIHQGWLSEDHRYFYQNDETDERDGVVSRTTTYVWDMIDLRSPRLISTYKGTTSSIDHNNYVLGDYLFQSNYTTGLRVLSRKNPTELLEIAYFDTFTSHDQTVFSGTWSNYPYFPSGIVVVSDKDTGLYVLEPMFMDTNLAPADIEMNVSTANTINESSASVSFSYTATVTNNSLVNAEDVTATHILASGGTVISIESTAICTTRQNFIDCRIGTMQPNEQVQMVISSSAPSASSVPYESQATAMNSDSNESNNKANGNATFSQAVVNPGSVSGRSGGGGAINLFVLILVVVARRAALSTGLCKYVHTGN